MQRYLIYNNIKEENQQILKLDKLEQANVFCFFAW